MLYTIPSSNITGSNVTDRGAVVGDRVALVGNFIIPKYVTDRGAVKLSASRASCNWTDVVQRLPENCAHFVIIRDMTGAQLSGYGEGRTCREPSTDRAARSSSCGIRHADSY